MMKKTTLSMMCVAMFATSCAIDPYTGESRTSKTAIGAGSGALLGAAIGAATSSKKSRKKAIARGALAGAVVGTGVGAYMDYQDKLLRQELANTGVSVTRDGNNIILNMPGDITFDYGKATLSSDFFDVLNSVAKVLKKYDKTTVAVAGFTDSTGARATNMTLSYNRANTVAKYLQSQGVKASRFTVNGYGPDYPIASNKTEAGRKQNRRVTIQLVPTEEAGM